MTRYFFIKKFSPLFFLFVLFFLLWRSLFYAHTHELPSALIGEPLPHFQLKTLYAPHSFLTPTVFHGQVSLLNVWATWCQACSQEQEMLMKISQDYHIPIYGIDYKDNADAAKKWLQDYGNPYISIGSDPSGDTAIDLGVYGTPETFIISPHGKIIYRHVGVIDQHTWDHVLYPLIQQYRDTQ